MVGIIGLLSKWKVMIAETNLHEITLKLDAGNTARLKGTGIFPNGGIFFNNLFQKYLKPRSQLTAVSFQILEQFLRTSLNYVLIPWCLQTLSHENSTFVHSITPPKLSSKVNNSTAHIFYNTKTVVTINSNKYHLSGIWGSVVVKRVSG